MQNSIIAVANINTLTWVMVTSVISDLSNSDYLNYWTILEQALSYKIIGQNYK